MAGHRSFTKTPYGKKIKPKKFVPKPLAPSPYVWIVVSTSDYKRVFSLGGTVTVRELILSLMKRGEVIRGKYFKDMLDSDAPESTVIVRGDTRDKSLDVIGRTTSDGQYIPLKKELDISKKIEHNED